MPTLDNEELTDAPSIVPDRDELVSYHRQKSSKPKPKDNRKPKDSAAAVQRTARGGSNALIYVVAVVAIAAAGTAGYLYTQLTDAQARVAALEQRLSSTDASVNQSSGALQIKINDVSTALAQLRDETLKKYNAQIDQRIERQAAQISALEKSTKNAQVSLSAVDKKIAEQNQVLAAARTDIDKLPPLLDQTGQRIDQQQVALNALSTKLKGLGDAQTKLDARLGNTEEWIDSINVFRKQMNREIVNIKQQIAGGKPMPLPPEAQ